MSILAIDPGNTESGYVYFKDGGVASSAVLLNTTMLDLLAAPHLIDDELAGLEHARPTLAIEMIASYGMPVGREVFETCVWIGRFTQAWKYPEAVRLIYRKDVKMELCGSPRAKDPHIRQALIDRLGAPGTKREPGPTYGVKSHCWAALGVAVTAQSLPAPAEA